MTGPKAAKNTMSTTMISPATARLFLKKLTATPFQ